MAETLAVAENNRYLQDAGDGFVSAELIVPTMHCAGCIAKIERGLGGDDHIKAARANLSTKRVKVTFLLESLNLDGVIDRLRDLGFEASPFSAANASSEHDKTAKELLVALAVAGFATANIMLFSVSVWDGGEMQEETRSLFHWISALIAAAAISFSGRPFFRSAWSALKVGTVNMDVPISLAVVLSLLASIFESAMGGDNVFFDAGVMLLFFLLIGRYLDQRMRARATDAAQNLLALQAVPATVVMPDGSHETMPSDMVDAGATVLVATGMRLPVDGVIAKGVSELDTSLVTGETLPVKAEAGTQVFAGTLNIAAPIEITTTGKGDDTLLAEIVRLMEAAEQGRSAFVRLADRLAKLYAPVVHILAAITFVGWYAYAGDAHLALMRAIAVLIITCPCALGLAVPVVQVVASGRLLSQGILVKSEDGLERLSEIDTVVFDKTGTITLGEMQMTNAVDIASTDLILAAGLGATSRHPLAQAVAGAAPKKRRLPMFDDVEEIPGAGLIGTLNGKRVMLGSRVHVGVTDAAPATGPELWLKVDDGAPVQFTFEDQLRPDAADTIKAIQDSGKQIILLSGDREEVVAGVADELGIADYTAACKPDDKIAILNDLKENGRNVLMVGDGLNDAPALRAAHVSISPASASDVAQTASDFVFQSKSLASVMETITVAKKTRRLVLENFALSLSYNIFAMPLAVLGYVTPLVAAIAMSSSSVVVTMNALRLKLGKRQEISS